MTIEDLRRFAGSEINNEWDPRGGHLQESDASVVHQRRLAMHYATGGAHDAAAEHLADALVAHAHPEERKLGPQLPHYLKRNS